MPRSPVVSRFALPIGIGVLSALALAAVATMSLELTPASAAWPRIVLGAPGGVVRDRAVVIVPGIDRSRPRSLEIATTPGPAAVIDVRIDAGPPLSVATGRGPIMLALPANPIPGIRLDLGRSPETATALTRVALREPELIPRTRAALAGLVPMLVFALSAARFGRRVGAALALVFGSVWALAGMPALLLLSLPDRVALARLALACVPALIALGIAATSDANERRWIRVGALVVPAFVFGVWVRGYFLPSTGSWDTEYWKASVARAETAGLVNVYGDASAVPPGAFLGQLRGAPRFEITFRGRNFVVDYPPLGIALWVGARRLVDRIAPALPLFERENVAAKLPAVLGDVLATLLLLIGLRRRPAHALLAAAAYWALPVSWLSSAVLGYFDGAVAPLVLGAMLAAGAGASLRTGLWFAAAALVKPTSFLMAPATAGALRAAGGSLVRAIGVGLACAALAFTPFVLAGTLPTAIVHLRGMFFQERLAGGYPSLWLLIGTLFVSGWPAAGERAPLVPLSAVGFPAALIANLLLILALVVLVRIQSRYRSGAAFLHLAALFCFCYGMLATGVHENHPHPLFLLMLATGLPTRRLRLLWAGASAVYVVNMLLMSGIGRFHGLRFVAIEPLARWANAARTALGFDATLLLAAINLAVFVTYWRGLAADLRSLEAT